MTDPLFIDGDRIALRPLSLEDIEGDYVSWLNDAEVCAYNGHHVFPYTAAKARAYIESVEGLPENVVLAIVAKDSGKHIGNVSLQNIDYINRNAEYAILLGNRDYWGKGIATEASLLILSHGFSALNLHRIYCGTSAENAAMRTLADALGFSQEGVRTEALFKNGAYADTIEYGLLAKDFKLPA